MLRIMLVQPFFLQQMGIMTLSAVLKEKGHLVKVAIGDDGQLLKKIIDFKPQIVGFSVMTSYANRFSRLSKVIKEHSGPAPLIVFGGPHPTFFPEVILQEGVDMICRGEGEGAFLDIAEAIKTGRGLEGINNTCIKRNGSVQGFSMRPLVELDSLPFPDRGIYEEYPFIKNTSLSYFNAGRGCPFNCTFCFNRKMTDLVKDSGHWTRYRSAGNLINEIQEVRRQKRVQTIMFIDDIFIMNKLWALGFLEEYGRKIKIPFFCSVRIDLVTPEIARALKDAGCYRVNFGVESGVESIRNRVLNKRLSDEDIYRGTAILRDAGLPFQTTNMMGLPHERLEDAIETVKFNLKLGTDVAWTTIYQPFPGTDLADYCIKEGLVATPIDTERFTDAHTASLLRQPDIEKIVRLQKFVYLILRFPFTLPVVKRLIGYDLNPLYFWVHRVTFLLFYYRRQNRIGLLDTLRQAIVAYKYYKPEKSFAIAGKRRPVAPEDKGEKDATGR